MAVETNKAVGSFTGEIGVTKAELGNKEAPDSFTGEMGITKVVLWNKEAAGSSISEIGVTKARLGNKEAAGGFTGEIGVTKAGLGNKEAAGTGMVTAASGIKLPAWSEKPREERKAEQVVALVTKERVSDSSIARMKSHPTRRIGPISDDIYDAFARYPGGRGLQTLQSTIAFVDNMVDVEQDCLRQHAEKGYAEIGVDYTSGERKVFVLPVQASGEQSEEI